MRSPRLAVALIAATALAVTGCTSSDDEPKQPAAGQSPSTAAPTTAAPSTPAPSTSAPTQAATSAVPASLADRLLPSSAVPGLNADWRWKDGKTFAAKTTPFGMCAKVDLASIGATEVIERTWFPPVDTDDNAAEQIAEFPDTATATRAAKVLRSWRAECAGKLAALSSAQAKVSKLVPVSTATGSGSWYLVTLVTPGAEEGRFHAFGIVADGTRIAVLRMDSGGQDYSYPAGEEPMAGMVRAAAGTLG